jgi:hypothetical protein
VFPNKLGISFLFPSNPTKKMVVYFAYGSNMNPKVLSGRRKVFPTLSEPALIQNWYLNFDVIALPYAEPAFASIGQSQIFPKQPMVHGVLHQVTEEDFKQIQRTEGHGYEAVKLRATKYNGKEVDCMTLVWKPRVHYHDRFYASKRYMNLLVEGATRFQLDTGYIDFLKTIPSYEHPGGIVHTVGKVLYLSLAITAALPVIAPMALCRVTKREIPSLLQSALDFLTLFFGVFYQYVFRPIFGPGAGESHHLKIE